MTEANIDHDYDLYCEFMDGLHTVPTQEEHEFESGMTTRDEQTTEMKEQLRQGLARSEAEAAYRNAVKVYHELNEFYKGMD